MKRFVVSMLALMLALTLTMGVALAETRVTSFSLNNVQAYSEEETNVTYSSKEVYKSTNTNHRIDVKHTVDSTSIKYNNRYHVVRKSTGNMVQPKWLTPGADYVPISNTNSIVAGEYYSVSARGNTYYSQNHGIQYIDMSGYMRAD